MEKETYKGVSDVFIFNLYDCGLGMVSSFENICIHIYNLLRCYDWKSTLGGLLPLMLDMLFPNQKKMLKVTNV